MDESNTNESQIQNSNAKNMSDYINSDAITSDMERFIAGSKTKTGYSNLDENTSLYPGLYVLGAISSLGKTTFVHQMSDQLAKAGELVLYFSLEQSTLELASKSLSRIMAIKDKKTAMSSLKIRQTGKNEQVKDAIDTYSSYAGNLSVIECGFSATIDYIEFTVNEYIKKLINNNNPKRPIVVIDYLQVIQNTDSYMQKKDSIDMYVCRLKKIQQKHNIAIIVISSLNRQNYLNQVDFESFKESGGIEYTADVVWGLQLSVLHDDVFDSTGKINEKRQKIKDAKKAIPRDIELCCLKNRFGVSSYSCYFKYYPQFDLFLPDSEDIEDLDFIDYKDLPF